jgi:hypothetical protein
MINLEITLGEAQAIADLIERECRASGFQSVATFGGISRQIIKGVQDAQQAAETVDKENEDG